MAVSLSVKPVEGKRQGRGASYREPPIQTVAAILAAGASISGALWDLVYVRAALRAMVGRGPAPGAPGVLDFLSIVAFPLAIAAAVWALMGLFKEDGWPRYVAVGIATVAVMLQVIAIAGPPTSKLFL